MNLASILLQGFRESDLYKIQLPEITLLVRPLSLGEAQAFQKVLQLEGIGYELIDEIEDEVYKKCVVETIPSLEESDFGNLTAGLVVTVVRLILLKSLPPQTEQSFEAQYNERNVALNLDTINDIKLIICSAFNYKPEDLEDWTWDKILTRFIEAKKVANGELLVSDKDPKPKSYTRSDPRTGRELEVQEFEFTNRRGRK